MIPDENLSKAMNEINLFKSTFEAFDLFRRPEPILYKDTLIFKESDDSHKTQEEARRITDFVLRKFKDIQESLHAYLAVPNELYLCDFVTRIDCRQTMERTLFYFDSFAKDFELTEFSTEALHLKDDIEEIMLTLCWDGVFNKLKTIRADLCKEAKMASDDISHTVNKYLVRVHNYKVLRDCFHKIGKRLATMNERLRMMFSRLKTLQSVVPDFPKPLLMISESMQEQISSEFESLNQEIVKIFLSINHSCQESEDVWENHFDVSDCSVSKGGIQSEELHMEAITKGTRCLQGVLNNAKSTQVLIIFAAISLVDYQQRFLKYYKLNKNKIDDPRQTTEWYLAEAALTEVREDDRLKPYLDNPVSFPNAVGFEHDIWYLKSMKVRSLRKLRKLAKTIDLYRAVLQSTKEILKQLTYPQPFQTRIFGDYLLEDTHK